MPPGVLIGLRARWQLCTVDGLLDTFALHKVSSSASFTNNKIRWYYWLVICMLSPPSGKRHSLAGHVSLSASLSLVLFLLPLPSHALSACSCLFLWLFPCLSHIVLANNVRLSPSPSASPSASLLLSLLSPLALALALALALCCMSLSYLYLYSTLNELVVCIS